VVKSYGLIGSVRLQLNGHNIIESKTEGDAFDLRIAEPFPELEAYCNSIHLEELDSLQHGHVPYIAILYNAIQSWRAQVCECSRYSCCYSASEFRVLPCFRLPLQWSDKLIAVNFARCNRILNAEMQCVVCRSTAAVIPPLSPTKRPSSSTLSPWPGTSTTRSTSR
jgi:hypothetical protein